jgi:hypothetical protein
VPPQDDSLAGALTQLVTTDTQSYLRRTAWLKAESSAAPGQAQRPTEVALQCGSDSGISAAANTGLPAATTFVSMGAARSLPAGVASPVAPPAVSPEACDPADAAGTRSCRPAANPPGRSR